MGCLLGLFKSRKFGESAPLLTFVFLKNSHILKAPHRETEQVTFDNLCSERAKNWFQNAGYCPWGWGAAGFQQHGRDEMLADVRRCRSSLSPKSRSSRPRSLQRKERNRRGHKVAPDQFALRCVTLLYVSAFALGPKPVFCISWGFHRQGRIAVLGVKKVIFHSQYQRFVFRRFLSGLSLTYEV